MSHLRGSCRLKILLQSVRLKHNDLGTRILGRPMSTSRFWEPNKKGGYSSKIKRPTKIMVKEGLAEMKTEMSKFTQEVREKFRADPLVGGLHHGDYEVVWKFNESQLLEQWLLTSDSDHNEGKSSAKLELSRNQTGIFSGVINTEVPKDGIIKNAGYAHMRSPKNNKSFHRNNPYDWSNFTHLLMRVRGDGRTYHLVLQMDRYFDVQWHDQYHYLLYTRGGPYWQMAKIPFSKFYLAGKGRVQDKQGPLMDQMTKISTLGVTIADGNPGPFQLEIDYIGVMFDAAHNEHFAYEMYECNPNVHS